MVALKTNPCILKRGCGIMRWMWLRELFRIWYRVRIRKIGRNIARQKKMLRIVAIELFKAGGNKCLKCLTNIFNILFKDKLPEE